MITSPRSHLLIPFCILAWINSGVVQAADDWFKVEGSDCSGSTVIASVVSAVLLSPLALESGNQAGSFYLPIPAGTVRQNLDKPTELITGHLTLDKPKAADLSKVFSDHADDVMVPAFASWGGALFTGLLLPPTIGTGTGLAFTYLFDQLNSASQSIKTLSLFIAAGGAIERHLTLISRKSDSAVFSAVTTEYSVKVGDEDRRFILVSCLFPTQVVVKEFTTTGAFNNKIVAPSAGNDWSIFDIEDAKFDQTILTLVEQDKQDYIFQSDEIENSVVVGHTTHRLSFLDGSWSRKRSDSDEFSILYKEIIAE